MNAIDWAMEPLRNYANFSDRASRSEYWWFMLFYWIVSAVAQGVDHLTGMPFISAIVSLGLFLPSLAVGIRRMHDTDRSGWWYVVPTMLIFASVIMFLVGALSSSGSGMVIAGGTLIIGLGLSVATFIFCVLPGTMGSNGYGRSPI
jgi:uncharacterized membrane protein YhaH (DUF805 family)